MRNAFEVDPLAVQSEQRAAYREYLASRDGRLDVLRGTLSRREERLAALGSAEARWAVGANDLPVVRAREFERGRAYSGEVLLFRALSRLHRTSGFGSPDEYERALRHAFHEGDDTEAFVAAEHSYGERLFGAPAAARAPSMALKLVTGQAAAGPWRRALILATEMVHAVALMNLLRVTRDVLRAAGATRDRIEADVLEVLTDAVGHVHYRRLGLEARDLGRARTALPGIALAVGHRSPEMAALGASVFASSTSILHRLENGLPAEVRKGAFHA